MSGRGVWVPGPAEVRLCVPRSNTPSCSAQGQATCGRGSARELAGWGAGQHSILPGPQAPFVPRVWPALRCPLALAPETFSEAPEGRDWT